jgi:amino acid transporter
MASEKLEKTPSGYYVRNATGLVREIGPWAALFVVFNWTVGIGIQYFAVTMIGQYPGANPILAYLISAIMVFGSAVATYLLSVAMPRSGGPYVHVSRVLSPILGYITGWAYFLYIIFGGVALNAYVAPTLLSAGLTAAGYATANQGLISIAKSLVNPYIDVAIGITILVVYMIILSLGYRAFKYLIYATFAIPFLGSIATFISFALITPTQAQSVWDNVFGSGAFAQLTQAAVKAGWNSSYLNFSLGATFAGLIPAIYSWTGPAIAGSFIAGEVRRPKRSMFFATVGAAVFVLLFQLLYIGGALHAFGYQFVQILDFGGPSLKLTPSIPLLSAVAWSSVSLIGVFIVVLGSLSAIHTQPAGLFLASRILFSMSFDRTMPVKMSEVSERFTAPTWNYLVITIVSIVLLYLSSPLSGISIFLTLGWLTFMGILALVLTNLTAVVFPFTRREIFKSADSLVQKTIGGVPVITIAGLIGLSGYLFALLVDASVIAGSKLGTSALLLPTFAVVLGIILYTYYASKAQKSGVDMDMLYKEIPPE